MLTPNYQLTDVRDAKFAKAVADKINKDFPGTATTVNGYCFITGLHWASCKAYVQHYCKIKGK